MGKQGKLWLFSVVALLVALVAWGRLAGWGPFLTKRDNVLWAEPVSWLAGIAGSVAGILSLIVSVYALRIDKKEPTGQTLAAQEHQRVEQPLAAGVPPPRALSQSPLIDRKDERVVLLARLTEGPWGVVIVTGERGVGKTRLVDRVVAELESASVGPRPRIFRHEAAPELGIDTRALIVDIEALQGDDAVRWSEVSDAPPADHVRASLEEIGDTWAVIVIERAENLLDPATHQLDDPELGEVFEVLNTVEGHRIAVVLVTQDLPKSAAQGRWAARAPIEVGRLERTFFLTFIGDRITNHKTAMLKAAHRYYDLFQGNLRLAELACVISQSPDHSPAWLSKHLNGMTAEKVPKFLIENLIAGLDSQERSVLEVLDAYGTPVDAKAVRALVIEREHRTKPPLDDVRAILTELVDKRVADKTRDGEYCLVLSEEERAWAGLPGEDGPIGQKEEKLLIHAAEELTQRRVSAPRTAKDLRLHLAEMRAFIRAGRPQSAYNRIKVIDRELRKRHCAFLLREPRERLRGKLAKFNPARELENDNALGEIYASSGDFDRASKAYGRALQHANDQQDLTRRVRVRANFAAAYWWIRDAQNARNQYEWALDDHSKLTMSDPEEYLALLPVRMGALEGLADCHRHWGKYDEAIQYAEEALAVPRTTGYPDTADDRVLVLSRSVSINLKLARWYAELGELGAAEGALTATEESLAGHDEDWLRSRYQVEIAQVRLGHDNEEAMQAAQKAVELARTYNDPIILLRARTILCQIHLARHDLVNATRQIENAAQYRYVGRPLLTPALRALVSLAEARRGGDDGGKAAVLLRDLLDEASRRIDRDDDDVTAWDFKGFALCGLRLNSQDTLVEAVDAFRMARAKTPRATPGLVDRLLFLLERLDDCGRTPERLQWVCEVLSAARARPHGA